MYQILIAILPTQPFQFRLQSFLELLHCRLRFLPPLNLFLKIENFKKNKRFVDTLQIIRSV